MLGQNTEGATEGWHINLTYLSGIEEGLVGGSEGQLHLIRVGTVLGQTGAARSQQTSILHKRHFVLQCVEWKTLAIIE